MDQVDLDALVVQLRALPEEIAKRQAEISQLASLRRTLAQRLTDAIGPTRTAACLGISRQVLWQVLNPKRAYEIKRRSSRSRSTA